MNLQITHLKASNSLSDTQELRVLYTSGDRETRVRLAENSVSPIDILNELAQDSDPEVRACVASNPSTPPAIVEFLSYDDHDDVRFAIASDPHTRLEILRRLTHDRNPYVGDRAQKTLDGAALEIDLEKQGFISCPGTHARLGELLVASGIISEREIDICVDIANNKKLHLGRALVQRGRIDKRIIVYALKQQTLIRLGQTTFELAVKEINKYATQRQR